MAHVPEEGRESGTRPLSIARPADFMTGLFLIGLAGLGFFQAAELPMGSAVRMRAGYVPRLLSFLLLAFGLAIIALSLAGKREPAERWRLRPLAAVLLVPVVYALTIEPLGLLIAVAACTLVAALGSRDSRPVEAILLALALAAFTVALFVWGLGLPMRPLPGG